jgi:hypothetical protein
MKSKNTFPASPCQTEGLAKIRCTTFKKVINGPRNYWGFVVPAPTGVAVLMESSFGQPLSR